jgi:hypothetical protein
VNVGTARAFDSAKLVEYLLRGSGPSEDFGFVERCIRTALTNGDLSARLEADDTWTILLEGECLLKNVELEALTVDESPGRHRSLAAGRTAGGPSHARGLDP